jgi:hypothetical protein
MLELAIPTGILAVTFGALELGFQWGYRRARRDPGEGARSQVNATQGAILGLLGLLLAFSFAAAATRFLERQDLIVSEANAIGTAALRADLLDEPYRSQLRAALQRYTEQRLEATRHLRFELRQADVAEVARVHAEIWSAARAGVAAKPGALLAVLNPVNELIDLHTTRLAASDKHLPVPVLILLLACSALAVGVTGYACGVGDRHRSPLSFALALLITAAFSITVDLDYPRMGLLQVSDAPLEGLRFESPEQAR